MQFAVALIEYLISGIVASVWVTAIAMNYIQLPLNKVNDYKEIFVVVYFPIAYVLGIYIDTTSSFLIRRAKELDATFAKKIKIYLWIRNVFISLYKIFAGNPKQDSYERSAGILSQSIPDTVRTMEAYVSRDRIARGAALNALAGGITAISYAPTEVKFPIFYGCLIMFIYSLFMYKRLRRLSSRFKRVAISKIKTKSED
ncbi:hypothetical protein [Pseudomonas sp. SWI6]|uniref:hypothetical protein n=1 Tax=Pseudomonas sp. SWI6 TaxID=2083051 RepID=UPI001319F55F|nr:hypothetical protein [Pseudomonas sp. SWI6]